MSKKKGVHNIPDDDLIKAILEGVDSDEESHPAFELPDSLVVPKVEDSFSPVGLVDLTNDDDVPVDQLNNEIPSASADFSDANQINQEENNKQQEDNKHEDRTVAIDSNAAYSIPTESQQSESFHSAVATDAERTIAVTAFAKRKIASASAPDEKVVIGMARPSIKAGLVHTSMDASLAQAENLKIAQQRIIDLEKELDHLRSENEELASAGQIIRQKSEEMNSRLISLEKEKLDALENLENEILILQGNLKFKETENQKSKLKIEELETRLKNDFKKIRVRERELENRLELARAEKYALVRSKDDTILELQRKIDKMRAELDVYRDKVQELNKTVDAYQDQMKRTVRALRLALTNLEVKDESFVALKKAE